MGMFKKFESFTFFPAASWSHTWERQHEVITRFAEEIDGKAHIFSPLGLIEYKLFSPELFRKFLNWRGEKVVGCENRTLENMEFVKEFYIHGFDRISAMINFAKLRRNVPFSGRNLFWGAYVNPTVFEFFKRSEFKVLDLAQRRQSSPRLSARMKELERTAVRQADLVFVDNIATLEDYKGDSDRIHYLPQGYDPVHFKPSVAPKERRTAIGYIGNLHDQIDYDYLCGMIEANPGRTFLIVGRKLDPESERLSKYGNVRMCGHVAKDQLQGYLDQMEYGLIPYKVNEFTRGVFPTKLFEYLGARVPVISTPIDEVIGFRNDRYLFIEPLPAPIVKKASWDGIDEFMASQSWKSRLDQYMDIVRRHLS